MKQAVRGVKATEKTLNSYMYMEFLLVLLSNQPPAPRVKEDQQSLPQHGGKGNRKIILCLSDIYEHKVSHNNNIAITTIMTAMHYYN